jgi:hypothetical protein
MTAAFDAVLDRAARAIYESSNSGSASWEQLSSLKRLQFRNQARAVFHIFVAENEAVGSWMAAALDDPDTCAEMKRDIEQWFDAQEAT